MQFEYGPDREKVRQVTAKGTMPATIDYVGGGLYENWMTATGTAQKNYLVTPNGLAAVVTRSSNLPDTIAYFHQDNLGSIVALTDAHGNLVQRLAYDAYGQRIVVANPAGIAGFGTQMGYTGHVQLDDLALVHMNGRVYDPVIGRFLSPDPNVQDPNNQQSLNRYSYVNNNPLSFTDPSGYFLSGFFHWFAHHWRMIAAVVITVIAVVLDQEWVIPQLGAWAGAGVAALGGFASGLIASDGNLQDGLIGAAAALAFYGIGAQFKAGVDVVKGEVGAWVQKVAEHGIVGGLQSTAEGGRFFSGFLSAAVPESASLASGDYAGWNEAEKIGAASVLGGTASTLGGGKFANGAVTGAFSEAFNDSLHSNTFHHVWQDVKNYAQSFWDELVDRVSFSADVRGGYGPALQLSDTLSLNGQKGIEVGAGEGAGLEADFAANIKLYEAGPEVNAPVSDEFAICGGSGVGACLDVNFLADNRPFTVNLSLGFVNGISVTNTLYHHFIVVQNGYPSSQ